ncbi:hypothetical protein MKX01_016394 [Papaver californicum]|nr:hypothetical protein MKX01_016394 [Papaver californicum]
MYSRRSSYSRSRSPYDRYSRSVSRSVSKSRLRSRSRSVENPGNNLYVTGLSPRITKKELEKHFSTEGGKVVDIHLVVDPSTRESRRFGFKTMSNVEEANRCLKYLDRSVLEGRLITVEKFSWQRDEGGRTPTPGRYLGPRSAHATLHTVGVVPDLLVTPQRGTGKYHTLLTGVGIRGLQMVGPRDLTEHIHAIALHDLSYSPYHYRRRRDRSVSPYYRRRDCSVSVDSRRRDFSASPCRGRHYRRGSLSPRFRRQYSTPYTSSSSRSVSPRGRRSSSRSYSRSASPRSRKHKMSYSPSPRRGQSRCSRHYSPSASPPPRSRSGSLTPCSRSASSRSRSPTPV